MKNVALALFGSVSAKLSTLAARAEDRVFNYLASRDEIVALVRAESAATVSAKLPAYVEEHVEGAFDQVRDDIENMVENKVHEMDLVDTVMESRAFQRGLKDVVEDVASDSGYLTKDDIDTDDIVTHSDLDDEISTLRDEIEELREELKAAKKARESLAKLADVLREIAADM